MRSYLAALVMCSVLVASSARAQEGEGTSGRQTSLGVGLRLGVAFPMGDASSRGGPVADYFSAAVPVAVDLGYFLDRSWFIGAYGQYGLARVGNGNALLGLCTYPGVSCSARTLRVGIDTWWLVGEPGDRARLWAGFGAGYERATLHAEDATGAADLILGGFELVPLQLGVDVPVGSLATIGPYASVGLGKYSTVSVEGDSPSRSEDILGTTWHAWVHLGVKATLAP